MVGDSCWITHITFKTNFSSLVYQTDPLVAVKCLIRFQSSEIIDSDRLFPSSVVVLEEGLTPGASSVMLLRTCFELMFACGVLYDLKLLFFLLHTWTSSCSSIIH